MMLPILISVSVAPVSYFFCASALVVEAKAMRVAAIAANGKSDLECTFFLLGFSAFLQFAEQMLGNQSDLHRAVGHQVDDEKQDDAEHRARKTFGDSFGDVRH